MHRDIRDGSEAEHAVDLIVAALRAVFGERAIDVAERQQGLADADHVADTWRHIAERLRHP